MNGLIYIHKICHNSLEVLWDRRLSGRREAVELPRDGQILLGDWCGEILRDRIVDISRNAEEKEIQSVIMWFGPMREA